MYEIISGNIVSGVIYQVVGGTSIVYNSVTYLAGEIFTGVSGVSTYTKTAGTEIVTFASVLKSVIIEVEQNIFTGIFLSDDSDLQSTIVERGDLLYYFANFTATDYIQNNKNFIPSESLIYISHNISKINSIFGDALNNGLDYFGLTSYSTNPDLTINYDTDFNIKSIECSGIKIFTAQRF